MASRYGQYFAAVLPVFDLGCQTVDDAEGNGQFDWLNLLGGDDSYKETV